MLCERCHEREAMVHVTRCFAPSGEMTRHNLCEPCFHESDKDEGLVTDAWTNYDPPPPEEPSE